MQLDARDEVMMQRYNENIRITEDLRRRMGVLEQRIENCITCRIVNKVQKLFDVSSYRSSTILSVAYIRDINSFNVHYISGK